MTVADAYRLLYSAALTVFAVLIGAMLVRSIIGPRITDRILSVNMIGTMVISCIVILSRLLHESYLADVALIYTMISFVSVLVLASVYIPDNKLRKKFMKEDGEGQGGEGQSGEGQGCESREGQPGGGLKEKTKGKQDRSLKETSKGKSGRSLKEEQKGEPDRSLKENQKGQPGESRMADRAENIKDRADGKRGAADVS
ncbi:MAG TPA: monovalent cation/H+ antiporter complex subunit F [Lachnospiraceae bacterium]|nr:monovalent cation/H+ antiporter complex subunit F [Lachnospiraceae bacterium]